MLKEKREQDVEKLKPNKGRLKCAPGNCSSAKNALFQSGTTSIKTRTC